MSERMIKMYRMTGREVAFSEHPMKEEEYQKYMELKDKGWVMVELDSNGFAVVTAPKSPLIPLKSPPEPHPQGTRDDG